LEASQKPPCTSSSHTNTRAFPCSAVDNIGRIMMELVQVRKLAKLFNAPANTSR